MSASPPLSEPRLGLGTVQFGMDYGITNTGGRIAEREVGEILELAAAAGVRIIDTAALYGDSERVLGCALPRNVPWRIVSKTPRFPETDPAQAGQSLRDACHRSLDLLVCESLYGLLVHNAADLLGPNGPQLWAAMQRLQAEGRVAKIGASIYSADEAEGLFARFDLDLLQVPFNAVDQRLVKRGVLQEAAARGIEVHARSAFLQGLLLAHPDSIESRFAKLAEAVRGLANRFAELGLSVLEGTLAAVLARGEIACAIVGVSSVRDLQGILAALRNVSQYKGELAIEQWSIDDESILNPAKWPQRVAAR